MDSFIVIIEYQNVSMGLGTSSLGILRAEFRAFGEIGAASFPPLCAGTLYLPRTRGARLGGLQGDSLGAPQQDLG